MEPIRSQIRSFRENAQAARESAAKATAPESREAYLKLASEWEALADEIESALPQAIGPRPSCFLLQMSRESHSALRPIATARAFTGHTRGLTGASSWLLEGHQSF